MGNVGDKFLSVSISVAVYPTIVLNILAIGYGIFQSLSPNIANFFETSISSNPYGRVLAILIKWRFIFLVIVTILFFYFYTWYYLLPIFRIP